MILSTAFAWLPLQAHGQDADDEKRILRVYDVSDIVDPQPKLLGDWLTGESQGTVSGLTNGGIGGGGGFGGGMGTGGGGMGAGAGGMGGGGGFFAIPSHIQPQFEGANMGVGVHGPWNSRVIDLADVLSDLGIGDAQLMVYDKLLLARATLRGHEELADVLQMLREKSQASPTMEIAMRLVPIAPDAAIDSSSLKATEIEALAAAKNAISATVRCGNGRTGSIASGARRSFVISAVPVVGANGSSDSNGRNVGYTPRVITPMIGLVGKVRPVLKEAPEGQPRTALIDVGIAYSVGSDEILSATFGTGQTIDRIDVTAVEFESQLSVVENQWTLAGVSTISDGNGAQEGLMAVVIQWREAR
ncbi:hypothetical protein Poly24_39050 [Rosistilla carotiformis]|uniref:Bacterial type II and III secretion system protein n=2 Tax=Rosistilla carotiformis TaxID=2528017 RepID=A0A518JXC9_9BACT|nr:hypothetical protein Poly24_39050 [Rosistilla carotiformis]